MWKICQFLSSIKKDAQRRKLFFFCLTVYITHTSTCLTALCPGLPGWAGTRKATPVWILLKQERQWQWQLHQLGHMQVCTSLQTYNHASTPPLSFLQAGCPSCPPTNSVKALITKQCVVYLPALLFLGPRKRTCERRWRSRGCWQSVRISTRIRAFDVCSGSRCSSSADACALSAGSTCARTVVSSTRTRRHTSVHSAPDSGMYCVTCIWHTYTHPFNGHWSRTTRWAVPERYNQFGFYRSKRQWVAVASAGPYASLHLAPDR